MLTESSTVDSITVLESGHVEVRRADRVLRDGVEIAKSYHRHVLAPGADITGEDEKVAAVATAIWTPEVIEAYQESVASSPSPAAG